jgi:branched-chain amino acid transport system ATP-binding protein
VLVIRNLQVVYDRSITALHEISLCVEDHSIVALLGPNGVGKSTALKAISGILKSERGEVTAGSIQFDDIEIHRKSPSEIVERGIVQVPEGRRLFSDLTVEENLLTGACRRPRRELTTSLAQVYEWFPRLTQKRKISAGYLSGGEQQMVAIGRALMAKPKILLLDEPSLGLAPQIVEQIFESLHNLRKTEGMAILLVEQNATKALDIADKGYIVECGKVVLEGTSAELSANDMIRHFYLGLSSSGDRRSFRETSTADSSASVA